MNVSSVNVRSAEAGGCTPKNAVPVFISVVMPAYNEAAAIEDVIIDHIRALTALGEFIVDWEIVCVDDGSSDPTLATLERLASTISRLKVVRHRDNKGISQSFADGFTAAKGTHIYATGADGQWPAANLIKMLRSVMAGSELVVGVRENRRQVYGLKRRLVSFAFNFSARVLFGVKTVDAGGIKLGIRDVFRLHLVSRSPFVEAERIIKAQRCGYRVHFTPVEFRPRKGGKETGVRWSNLLGSIGDCLRCAVVYGIGGGLAES
ncbi:MAG: glycosyltransferase family 2 protein [Terriglobia bacterium]